MGERDETISLTYIALSSFKCIKIAVTKSYLINCITALKFVLINYMCLIIESFVSSLKPAGAKCASRDEVCQAHFSSLCNNPINLPCLGNDIIVK